MAYYQAAYESMCRELGVRRQEALPSGRGAQAAGEWVYVSQEFVERCGGRGAALQSVATRGGGGGSASVDREASALEELLVSTLRGAEGARLSFPSVCG
jgi:hypothetical protein